MYKIIVWQGKVAIGGADYFCWRCNAWVPEGHEHWR